MEYTYYLEGYEDDFGPWTDDVKKQYTNLEGGEYVFHVKARLPNDQETSVASSSLISVPVPWYNQPVYYAIGLVLLIITIYTLFRYRTYRLRELNKRLEKIINSRTQELLEQREQLREANDELTLTNKELDNFVYRSSHDLIAPLKSIKGLIGLAKRETSEKDQLDYLGMMNMSVVKLEEFIKSIMEYSVNSNREVRKDSMVFDELIESIKKDLRYFDNAEKVTLIKNYPPDLKLLSDKNRLMIILSNLITNCIKYHNYRQDNPVIEVNVETDVSSNTVDIEIRDNGTGIDSQHLDKVFDMFFRAAESKNQGSGLGLYIV